MNLKKFYDTIRKEFKLTPQNIKGFDFILGEAEKRKVPLWSLAYILATVWHETANTMTPVREYGGETYLKKKKYYPYVGMGYVQLTWDYNYKKASDKLGVDFLKDPKKLLEPKYAVEILFAGMKEGWFTGKSLKDYIDNVDEADPEDLREFKNARKVINGTDKAQKIAQEALVFEGALKASGYLSEASLTPVSVVHPEEPKPSVRGSNRLIEAIVKLIKLIFRRS